MQVKKNQVTKRLTKKNCIMKNRHHLIQSCNTELLLGIFLLCQFKSLDNAVEILPALKIILLLLHSLRTNI